MNVDQAEAEPRAAELLARELEARNVSDLELDLSTVVPVQALGHFNLALTDVNGMYSVSSISEGRSELAIRASAIKEKTILLNATEKDFLVAVGNAVPLRGFVVDPVPVAIAPAIVASGDLLVCLVSETQVVFLVHLSNSFFERGFLIVKSSKGASEARLLDSN